MNEILQNKFKGGGGMLISRNPTLSEHGITKLLCCHLPKDVEGGIIMLISRNPTLSEHGITKLLCCHLPKDIEGGHVNIS